MNPKYPPISQLRHDAVATTVATICGTVAWLVLMGLFEQLSRCAVSCKGLYNSSRNESNEASVCWAQDLDNLNSGVP